MEFLLYMNNFNEIKKFILKIATVIIIPLLLTGVICYNVDAFSTLHPLDVRIRGNDINRNYVKTYYVVHNPKKFNSYIFGSSRVGNIHVEKIKNEKCYNMYYGKGVPKENLYSIISLIESGCTINKIYLGVDSYSYTEEYTIHDNEPLRATYRHLKANPLKFIELYYDLSIAVRTIKEQLISGEDVEESSNEIFYKYGWNHDYGETSDYDFDKASPTIGNANYLYETLEDIKAIKKVCDENDVELIVFTNPMHYITYEASLDVGYLDFLKGLAKIATYYNFSGYNDITTNNKNYYETSHYTAETSDMIIDIVWNGKEYSELLEQGFGYKVTKNNIDELIDILIEEREEYLKNTK